MIDTVQTPSWFTEAMNALNTRLDTFATREQLNDLNARLDGLATIDQLNAVEMRINTRLNGIDTRLNGIDTQLNTLSYRLSVVEIRTKNSTAVLDNAPIEPLPLPIGVPVPVFPFPANRGELRNMQGANVDAWLVAYGLIRTGLVDDRVIRLATHIGIRF